MEPQASETRKTVAADLLASVVVFLVALPLCMGIAIASGAPPAAGLITGMVGGLLVGFIQGSPLQVSGPAAGLAVLVWELIQRHGFAALGPFVVAAGLIQIGAALLRGGRWFRAVPPSVIHGMLAGIGVLIFASQFHIMVDDAPKGGGLANLLSIPAAIWKGISPAEGLPHQEAAITGLVTVAVILAWTRVPEAMRTLPGPLAGVLAGTLLANLFGFPIAHVEVPDDLLSSVAPPSDTALQMLASVSFWGSALALAVIASAETLLCASAVDRMHTGPRTNYNRELLAQGVGNTLCGALGALPMTGVIVRSSANVQAGARTRASAILHGGWILLLVVVLPQVLRLVPVASLAAVLVYTGYKLVNPAIIKELRKYGRGEVAIYAVTVAAIVSSDLLTGVLLGFGLAVAKLLFTMSNLRLDVRDAPHGQRTTVHLLGSATFLRLADIAEALERIEAGRQVQIRFDRLEYLDHATLELLSTWSKQYAARGGSVDVDWEGLHATYHASVRPGAPDDAEHAPTAKAS